MFIMLLLFFPYLLIPFIIFFALLIVFLPFKYTLDSLWNLFTIPSQIYQIATNPALRKNHGLEHATANILEKEFGYRNIAGYAEEDGFYIIGVPSILEVEQAACKGLSLMKKGYSDLAIHKKCGTSITTANFISAVVFLTLIFFSGHFSITNMIIAILLANITGPLLGQYVQKYFTTSGDVAEMEIITANYKMTNLWKSPVKIFVRTTHIPYIQV